jgi:hypothetical protein
LIALFALGSGMQWNRNTSHHVDPGYGAPLRTATIVVADIICHL